ncbi:hypothetical protein K435DRAFT_857755 [Dendrothele bispora CBS 962.96]|uniref:Uncharacterized protein n=1 Tax=Dendrothele bispora (strain CBS 962.96) TaxID=1314807 RepID=A0A4S8M4V6_DENBC|nr:hypothetical protein K435DRAFT_857755 [Dendrothele bispora CBS 962.96]
MDRETICEALQEIDRNLHIQLQSGSPYSREWAAEVGDVLGKMMEAVNAAQNQDTPYPVGNEEQAQDRQEPESMESFGIEGEQGPLGEFQDDDYDSMPATGSDKEVRERVCDLIAEMEERGRVGPKELFKYLSNDDGTRREKEDRALGMLLRRFRLEDRKTWQAVLRKYSDSDSDYTWPTLSQEVRESIRVDDIDNRIVRVHGALSKDEDGDIVNEMVQHIIATSGLIKFACDYDAVTRGKGGRRRKQLITKTMFQLDPRYRDFFEGLSVQEEGQRMTELEEEFKRFRKELEQVTRGRNKLLEVYESYGMGVFLDPFWRIDNVLRTRRTAHFSRILAELPKHIPRHQYDASLSGLTEDQENAFHIIVWVLAERAPNFVSAFVRLVNRHPCNIIRQRDNLEEGEIGYLEPVEYELLYSDDEDEE